MAGLETRLYGISFESVKEVLVSLFFKHDEITQEELDKCRQFVIPMQHNFENPIEPGTQDTWIEYWIDSDDRLTQDWNEGGVNYTQKLAKVTVRFLGTRGEEWAKLFHHMAQRNSSFFLWRYYCHAEALEYISPIIPTNVDYFRVGNTTIAFTVSLQLKYFEGLDFRVRPGEKAERLMYIGLASGELIDAYLKKEQEADGAAPDA